MASQNVFINLKEIEVGDSYFNSDGGNVTIVTENCGKREIDDDEDWIPHKKRGGAERPERYWTTSLTLKLIELVKIHYSSLTDKRYRKQAWIDIWELLKPLSTGIGLTLRQVQKKWKNLHHTYNHTVEQQRKLGKNRVRQREYFEEIDEICGTKPSLQNLISDQCILPLSSKEANQQAEETAFRMKDLQNSSLVTEISEAVSEAISEIQDGAEKSRKLPTLPHKEIEAVMGELIEESRKSIINEGKKVEVMERDAEMRKEFNDRILSAINKRTEAIDRQQVSSLKVENILLMTQRYDDKLDKLENKIIKLENGMYRLETKIENYLNKIDK